MFKARIIFALFFIGMQVTSTTARPGELTNTDGSNGAAVQKAPQPVAVTPEYRHDFGSVVEGMDIVHDFVVKNEGGMDLLIEKVAPG